jgi:hypothetical protein
LKVSQWIQECASKHSLCQPRHVPKFPTRVLDIGSKGDFSDMKLSEGNEGPVQYAALSHCWGGKQPFKTTLHTLHLRKQRILWVDLPKTFQDAVQVSHWLGMRYIWIDSLCIIQDDDNDWRIEAAKMASIYEDSYVTIMATRAESSDMGFLSRRQGTVELRSSRSDDPVFMREKIDHDAFFANGDVKEFYPTLKRGWCFQERILATRILHFTPRELVFECITGCYCECGEFQGIKSRPLVNSMRPFKQTLSFACFAENTPQVGMESEIPACLNPSDSWKLIVKEYATKKLTFNTDTFPALAGVASRIQMRFGGRFLGGLWESNFLDELMWFSLEPKSCQRPSKYVAPSFSWASRLGHLDWPDCNQFLLPHIEILNIHITLRSNFPFDQVNSGFLKVRGSHISVKCASTFSGGQQPQIAADGDRFIDYIPDVAEDNRVVLGSMLRCLSIMKADPRSPYEYNVALVLLKSTESGECHYERIGFASRVPRSLFYGVLETELIIV